MTLRRRAFIAASLGTAGALLLEGSLPRAAGAEPGRGRLSAWITIRSDDTVELTVSQAEMGQGIQTSLPAVLADELDADWSKIVLVQGGGGMNHPELANPRYGWQFTGNAESTRAFFDLLRRMGAAGREMLVEAAAQRFGVPVSKLRTDAGRVLEIGGARAASYGELSTLAATLPVPKAPKLKSRSDFKLIGRPLPRLDVPDKVTGRAIFGIDVERPGMLHAAILQSPVFGARLLRIENEALLRKEPGVIDVVSLRDIQAMPLPDAVAIVASTYWQARTALRKAVLTFSPSEHADLDSAMLDRLYARELEGDRFSVAYAEGDAPVELARAERAGKRLHRGHYVSAWQAHAPLEPMNCTAEVQGATCTLWAPTQGQQMCQLKVGAALGIPPTDVTVHRTLLGGGFGRRLVADYAIYAALVARQCQRPVKLIWSRDEDMAHDLFRPRVENQIVASLGDDGLPAAVRHRIVSPTILSPVMGNGHVFRHPEVDPSTVEGLTGESPYGLGAVRVEVHVLDVPVPTMVWRGTGFSPNLFALESFIDELAGAAGVDPLLYRRRLVLRGGKHPRALALLDRLAQASNWRAVPRGTFQGMALGYAFETYFGQVVDITLDGGDVRVENVTSVIDAGLTVDPEIARASIQSGIVWGLTQALHSEIRFAKGSTVQRNFDGFRILALPETPRSKTIFIDSHAPPGGMGELGPLGIPAALVNALAQATSVRHRELPLIRQNVTTPYQRQFAGRTSARRESQLT